MCVKRERVSHRLIVSINNYDERERESDQAYYSYVLYITHYYTTLPQLIPETLVITGARQRYNPMHVLVYIVRVNGMHRSNSV